MDESATAPTPVTTQKVPSSWPGAFGAYKFSRDVVRANIGTVVGLIVFSMALSIIISSLGGNSEPNKSLFTLFADLVGVWINAALVVTFLTGVKSNTISFGDALKKGGYLYLNYLGMTLLTAVIMFLSILALVVPFFIIMPRLVLAGYFLVDQDLGPVDALKASWNATKGHSGNVWGIIGVSLLMAIGILVLIGIYFLVMYSAVLAVLYAYIQSTQSAPQVNQVAPLEPVAPAENPTPVV